MPTALPLGLLQSVQLITLINMYENNLLSIGHSINHFKYRVNLKIHDTIG